MAYLDEINRAASRAGLKTDPVFKTDTQVLQNGATAAAGAAASPYQKIADKAALSTGFRYDREEDPTFDAYRSILLREGERAAANALAQSSAATGGIPSSWALAAAQQANNYYGAKLADVVPELELQAYNRFINEAEMRYQQERQKEQDAADVQQQKYENALRLYQLLGYATPEVAEILGIQPAGNTGGTTGGTAGGSGGVSGGQGGMTGTQEPADKSSAELQTWIDTYPDGVTSRTVWNQLVSLYGAEALEAAGLRYKQTGNQSTGKRPAGLTGTSGANVTIKD